MMRLGVVNWEGVPDAGWKLTSRSRPLASNCAPSSSMVDWSIDQCCRSKDQRYYEGATPSHSVARRPSCYLYKLGGDQPSAMDAGLHRSAGSRPQVVYSFGRARCHGFLCHFRIFDHEPSSSRTRYRKTHPLNQILFTTNTQDFPALLLLCPSGNCSASSRVD